MNKHLIILILLSSCVSMSKEEQTKNILALPSLQSSMESSLQSAAFSLGHWPEANWWEMFHSSELNGLIEQALQENPTLIAVRKRIQFAEQTAKVVRSRLFPLLYFNAEDDWELLSHHGLYRALNDKIPINATLIDLTLSFSYEFDFWGKNRHLYHAALGEMKAQEAEAAEVALMTTTAVTTAYFALKTNLIRERLYEALYNVRFKTIQLQNDLQNSFLISSLMPLFTEENVLEAKKLLCSIREQVEVDKHLLNILIGRGPDDPLKIEGGLPELPKTLTVPSTLSADLLARRPDLMAQIWKVEALANEVGAAKADFYPNVNLSAFLGLESIAYNLLFRAHSKTAGVEPAIHLPIFTAGEIRANLRAKKALFDEAVYHYNELILRSTKEVADLLVIAESLYKQKYDQERIVGKAQERLEITQLRKESGLDSRFDTLAVEEELIHKQLEDIALLYAQYRVAIKLVQALGGGYQG